MPARGAVTLFHVRGIRIGIDYSWFFVVFLIIIWLSSFYRSILDFDPVPYWAKVTCPVLLLFGELDANVPPKESIPPIQRALERAGNRDVTIKTFPGANHVLLAARTGARSEYPHLNRFVPGYFEVMRQWLQDHVELPR